jgi:uncharacterized protein YgiM (DUF1202 family)
MMTVFSDIRWEMGSSNKNAIIIHQRQWITALALCAAFSLVGINNTIALPGDELIIIESLVNVRSGPTTDAESLFKMKGGRTVIEVQRERSWVEVETNREDYPTGWIHKSLLKKTNIVENTSSPTRFENFMRRFEDQNEFIKNDNGTVYFADAKNKGNGQIEVLATQNWLEADVKMKNESLSAVFKIWSDVTPVGKSISVQVVDEDGLRHTLMMR